MKNFVNSDTSTIRTTKVAAQFLIWVLLFIFPLFYNSLPYVMVGVLSTHVMLLALVFYSNMYLLIPKLLLNQKYITYSFVLLITIAFIVLVSILFNTTIIRYLPTLELEFAFSGKQKIQDVNSLPPIIISTLLAIAISTSLTMTNEYIKKTKQGQEIEKERLIAELAMLKLQINPHFFFNTLNNIYYLAMHKSNQTPTAILKLAGLMRYIIYDSATHQMSLVRELEYIHDFIDLQRLRLNENVNIYFQQTGDFENKFIEPLIILPFIENAFKHGVSPTASSDIDINLTQNLDVLSVHISNNKFCVISEQPGGIGLTNCRKRLELLYPGQHTISIGESENTYYVNLTIKLLEHGLPYN